MQQTRSGHPEHRAKFMTFLASIHVRREALTIRMEVRDLHRRLCRSKAGGEGCPGRGDAPYVERGHRGQRARRGAVLRAYSLQVLRPHRCSGLIRSAGCCHAWRAIWPNRPGPQGRRPGYAASLGGQPTARNSPSTASSSSGVPGEREPGRGGERGWTRPRHGPMPAPSCAPVRPAPAATAVVC